MEWNFRLNWPALVEEAKQRRKAQNFTQQRLAALAEVSAPTLSRFENGEERIELSSAMRIFGALGMLDQRMLTFPQPEEHMDFDHDTVVFWGRDNHQQKLRCAISRVALEDHFKGDGKRLLKIAIANRDSIQQEARRKYLADRFEKDGSLLIRAEDFY